MIEVNKTIIDATSDPDPIKYINPITGIISNAYIVECRPKLRLTSPSSSSGNNLYPAF